MKYLKLSFVFSVFGLLAIFIMNKVSKDESFQLFGELVAKVETNDKLVALTFDDGPTVGKTEQILAILQEGGIKATFYLVGEAIANNMDQAKQIIAAGHEVGNHSYTHQRMVFKPYRFIGDELTRTSQLLKQAGYNGDITFRPPYGRKLFLLPYYLMQQDITTVTWNVEPDSVLPLDSTSEKLIQYTLEKVSPGSIILMHVMFDSRRNSMAAIPEIIRSLKRKGYKFVTVSELISRRSSSK